LACRVDPIVSICAVTLGALALAHFDNLRRDFCRIDHVRFLSSYFAASQLDG
jgi:hypothetical protein